MVEGEGWDHGQQKGQRQTMHVPAHGGLALSKQNTGGSLACLICSDLSLPWFDLHNLFEFFHELLARFVNEIVRFVNEPARELNELSHVNKTKLYAYQLRNN
jgi:hypothetical protein